MPIPEGPTAPDAHTGRRLAALLLLQLSGLIAPFVMLAALYAPPGFLASAAPHGTRIQWSLLLLLANGALSVAVARFVRTRLRDAGSALADWLLVLSAAWLFLQAVDNTRVMEMMALSRSAVDATAGQRESLAWTAASVAAARRYTHYSVLLVIGGWMLVLYSALWRARVVPPVIGALGVLAAVLHLGGVSLPVLIGYPALSVVAPGLAVSHVAVCGWLFSKGWPPPPP